MGNEAHVEPWLVQLEIRKRRKVSQWMKSCAFELQHMPTTTHLNLLPLSVYAMLLSMDWIYKNNTKVDCFEKEIKCLDEHGKRIIL